jgi:hypothetical protein
MARRSSHLSPCLGCGRPTRGSHCDACAPNYNYDSEWRNVTRPAVLARDGHRCRIKADDGCTVIATSVHRLPEFGPYHDGNLDAYVSGCAHCHGVVDAPRAKA